jgi:multidrug resistance efflux pump
LLALGAQRLNREEAAVRRAEARRERQQAEIDRASAETERGLAAWLPDPIQQVKRAEELRQQAFTAIEALARTEDEIARIHEELAASRPGRRDEYRRTAEQARQTARRAREALRSFTG